VHDIPTSAAEHEPLVVPSRCDSRLTPRPWLRVTYMDGNSGETLYQKIELGQPPHRTRYQNIEKCMEPLQASAMTFRQDADPSCPLTVVPDADPAPQLPEFPPGRYSRCSAT